MQNESYPRRNDRRSANAKGVQGGSFCRLQSARAEHVWPLNVARYPESPFKLKNMFGRDRFPLCNRLRRNPNDARNCRSAISGAPYSNYSLSI
ncbi:hypothetical protein J2768_002868 [Agrobacterium tumefaciens]|nr:hypothetical protein [Agrobacterium tumefaciens]MDP9788741.1 hypothetical protein [Agrobacterium tumefaciens]